MPGLLFALAADNCRSYLNIILTARKLSHDCHLFTFLSFSTLYGQLDLYNPEGVSKRMLLVKVGQCLVMVISAILIS